MAECSGGPKVYTFKQKLERVAELCEAYDNMMEVSVYDKDFMEVLNQINEELDNQTADSFFEANFCTFEKLNEACDEFGYSRVERQK